MTNRNEAINEFADKWITQFSDNERNGYDLADDVSFANECFALKFEMDCGKGFFEKYGIDNFDDVTDVLSKVDDLDYLASVIFSYWRYFNHCACSCSEILDHRDWFIMTLTRLKELAR